MKARSRFAFLCSVKLLFRTASRGVCMWSLTFPSPVRHWSGASMAWARFRRRVNKIYRGNAFPGIRVAEWHPNGHGWHIHFLTSVYRRVEAVREAAQLAGFGRVNVIYLGRREQEMSLYLAKHFTKDFRDSRSHSKGQHKWSCMGGFEGVHARDIEYESTFTAWLHLRLAGNKCTPKRFYMLRREWLVGPPTPPWEKSKVRVLAPNPF